MATVVEEEEEEDNRIFHHENDGNGKKKKTDFHKNLLIVYHPIDFCVIQCRNATPASKQPASYYE